MVALREGKSRCCSLVIIILPQPTVTLSCLCCQGHQVLRLRGGCGSEEEGDDSDYDTSDEERSSQKKKKSKVVTSTPERTEPLAKALSPEMQSIIAKINIKTADTSKQKQKLDERAASVAIHRWGRKNGVDLLERQLTRLDFEGVLQNYGRGGAKVILTTIATLKKCWENGFCDSDSKIHQKCEYCEDELWNNLDQPQETEYSETVEVIVRDQQDTIADTVQEATMVNIFFACIFIQYSYLHL